MNLFTHKVDRKATGIALAAAIALGVAIPAAYAAGIWTNGAPQVPITGTTVQPGNYPQMTGAELFPFDTGLPNGAYPQSAAVNGFQLGMLGAAMGSNNATATGTGGTSTATLTGILGVVKTAAITTAAGATHTITVTDTAITANSTFQYAVYNIANTGGQMVVTSVTPAAGSFVVVLTNAGATAVNGAVAFAFSAQ